jgi:hypothetical protein
MRLTISLGAPRGKKGIELDHRPSGSGEFYVYVHRDSRGKIFYVGKGTRDRAWSEHRRSLWHKYVQERSGGRYAVQIASYHRTSEEAEEALIAFYGDQIVNWVNFGRKLDYDALEKYHSARNANRAFMAETRLMEATDPELCVERYRQAMEKMFEYEA